MGIHGNTWNINDMYQQLQMDGIKQCHNDIRRTNCMIVGNFAWIRINLLSVEWSGMNVQKRQPVSDKSQTKHRDMHWMILTICKHRTRMIAPYKFWQIQIDKTPWLTMNGDKSVTNDGWLMALTCFNHYLEMARIQNPKKCQNQWRFSAKHYLLCGSVCGPL